MGLVGIELILGNKGKGSELRTQNRRREKRVMMKEGRKKLTLMPSSDWSMVVEGEEGDDDEEVALMVEA